MPRPLPKPFDPALNAAHYELQLDELAAPLDFAAVYGRKAPQVVEIGCGGGRTLIGMALSRPERNYLGIEQAGEYFRMMLERISRRKMENVRASRADAAYLVQRFFGDDSVQEYHIYFPDPWPKKRHRKRRLFSDEFCANLKRTLEPAGKLYVASDYHEYYLEILERLKTQLPVQEHPDRWEDAPEGRTNFEVKYIKEGRPIYRLVATK